jgi:hypothetical protein
MAELIEQLAAESIDGREMFKKVLTLSAAPTPAPIGI